MEKCGFRCEKCKAVDRFDKDMTIFRFPKILVIHLKRFTSGRSRQKLSTSVSIPKTLDMSPYGPHSTHESKNYAKRYTLYGISHHSGTLNGGHYIGQVKDFDENKWYLCNDSSCSSSKGPDSSSSSAYVLFFI